MHKLYKGALAYSAQSEAVSTTEKLQTTCITRLMLEVDMNVCFHWNNFKQILLDDCPPLSLKELHPTAWITLCSAASAVIQHVELTDRRMILVIVWFVTIQSSRLLYMLNYCPNTSSCFILIYVTCHHIMDLIKMFLFFLFHKIEILSVHY